jgi:hypothetical protein
LDDHKVVTVIRCPAAQDCTSGRAFKIGDKARFKTERASRTQGATETDIKAIKHAVASSPRSSEQAAIAPVLSPGVEVTVKGATAVVP